MAYPDIAGGSVAYRTVDVFRSSGRYSPPGQLFLEMKMPRSQRKTIEQIKEALEEIRRSQKRSRAHRRVIKNKYNAPEVKSAPQEKDLKIYFPGRQVGPTVKDTCPVQYK
jgi:hypothetical protein